MQSKSNAGRTQAWLAGLSQLADVAAPVLALVTTAILITERTPRREPLVYAVLLGALMVLTWASASSRRAYGLWALYIGAFAIFSVARSFADETGIPIHVDDLIVAEKTLTFGTVPTVWLQDQMFDPARIGWVDRATTYIHWSYFVLPHIFAAHLFLGQRQLFERYVLLFVGVLSVGLLIYFIFPAAPPWVASLTGSLDPTHKVVTEVGSEFNVNLYARFESSIRSSNPVAAMPSIHMAISVLVMLMAFHLNRVLGGIASLYAGAMGFSLVYLGEHYVLDIVAGVLVTVGVYVALALWFQRRDRRPTESVRTEAPELAADLAAELAQPVPVRSSQGGYSGPNLD